MACLSFCRCKLYGLVSISNQTVLSNAKRSHFRVGAVGAIPARSARRADSYKHTIQCTGRVERRNCSKPVQRFPETRWEFILGDPTPRQQILESCGCDSKTCRLAGNLDAPQVPVVTTPNPFHRPPGKN